MNPLRLLIPLRWIGGILLIFLLWQTVIWLLPDPEPLSPEQKATLSLLLENKLQNSLPGLDPESPTDIGVVHLISDPTHEGTQLLIQSLASIPGLKVVDDSPFQRLFKDLGKSVKNATTPGEIAFAGRDISLPLLAMGRIIQLPTPETPTLKLWLGIYDTRKAEWLHNQTHSQTWTSEEFTTLTSPPSPNSNLPSSTNKLAWLITVVILPWITLPLFHKVLERNSNLANGAWLLTLTLIGLATGAAVFQINFQNGPGFWAICVSILLAVYNLLTLDRIAGKA